MKGSSIFDESLIHRDGFFETNTVSFIAISFRKIIEFYHAPTYLEPKKCVGIDNLQKHTKTHTHTQIKKV